MTLSLAAVFIPVLFMSGIIGRLLHEFAVTISCAILISGFVSLTLTPMLCSRFLRPPSKERHGHLYALSERFFDRMFRTYEGSLTWVMKHRVTTMVTLGVVMLATALMFYLVPKGFLPSDDTGQIFGATEAAQGISFDDMVRHQQALADVVSQDPNVDSFSSSVGGGSLNQGRIFIRPKPRSERRLSADEVIQELSPNLAACTGINAFLQNPPPIRIGGQLTKSLYQLTLQSADTKELYKYAPLLQSKMSELPGFQDVTTDLQIQNPQVNVEIDRDKAQSLGVTANQIESVLFDAYGSRQVSTIYA